MSPRLHIIGGGIAGLAAAVFAIRDGGMAGEQVTIYEETGRFGGSLDAEGSLETGYFMRGERMLSKHFVCLFDLLSGIPSYDDPAVSAGDDILAFTKVAKWQSMARLLGQGARRIDVSTLGLSNADRLALLGLMLRSEKSLARAEIAQMLPERFFGTPFWLMWSTMFAFQPWHSAIEMRRYLFRFLHLFPHLASMNTVHRTRYDQYHSIVLPLQKWLEQKGAKLATGARVIDMTFRESGDRHRVTALRVAGHHAERDVTLGEDDRVIFTNGSMTAASSVGSLDAPAILNRGAPGGAWSLWRRIAEKHPGFGRPDVFIGDIDKSKFLSFTATTSHPRFRERLEGLTHASVGREGLITFVDSNWMMTIKANPNPHFPGQPEEAVLWWGYGLREDRPGNFVNKPMTECSGADLLREAFLHLGFDEDLDLLLAHSQARPCMMPYVMSQFMPRALGDRPQVVPAGSENLAFVGQFCEVPYDTVFTVEYSVRSAKMAVKSLLGLHVEVPPLYKGWRRPAVLLRALREAYR